MGTRTILAKEIVNKLVKKSDYFKDAVRRGLLSDVVEGTLFELKKMGRIK
jgi:hypothetical protein